jgi:hypothetical protein
MTSVITTTGTQSTTTNDSLLSLQKQNTINATYDVLPTPTSITGEETLYVDGVVVTNYTGGNKNISNKIRKLMYNNNKINKNMKKMENNDREINKMKKMLKKINGSNKNSKNNLRSKRVFQLVDYPKKGKNYGNYTGTHPKQAANKVMSALARKIDLKNTNNNNQIVFWIMEKKNGKKYCYTGTRIKLVKPKVVIRGNNKINYWYKNSLIECKHQGVNKIMRGNNNYNFNSRKNKKKKRVSN